MIRLNNSWQTSEVGGEKGTSERNSVLKLVWNFSYILFFNVIDNFSKTIELKI